MERLEGTSMKSRMVGGECIYKEYKGLAQITSIRELKESKPIDDASKAQYEVKFVFKPEEQIKELFAKVEGE
ncbi:MAG: hypothetical protein R6U40_03070, partial [Desulfobacterales bacterium]